MQTPVPAERSSNGGVSVLSNANRFALHFSFMQALLPSPLSETADYAVSAVRYGGDGLLIYKARVHRVRAGQAQAPLDVLRAQLLAAIAHGRTFTTIALKGRTYSVVAPIRLVLVEGRPYLRGDAEQREADSLPGISEF